MKIIIFSDSHSNLELLDRIIDIYKPDRIYGLGDYDTNEFELINRGIFGVRGNSYFDPDFPINRIFNLEGFNILLTHGHTHNVRSGLLNLSLFSKENNVDIAFYGHTHVANITKDDNKYFINPGSITIPHSPSFPTFIYMDINNNKANIKILDALLFKVYKEVEINK